MKQTLKESFLPIIGVLLLLFLLLAVVRYQVGLEAEQVTVITIHAPLDKSDESGMEEFDTTQFAGRDSELAAIATLIGERKWQQAEERLQTRLATIDDSPGRGMLGVLRYQQQRYNEALQTLNEAAGQQPVWPGLYFYRARTNSKLQHVAMAMDDYRRVIEINPNHFEAHYNLGLLLLQQGGEEAVTLFDRATTMAGGARRARAYTQLGRALLARGETGRKQAVMSFNMAIRLAPTMVEPRLELALMAEGDETVQEQLLAILDLSPHHPATLFSLAQHLSDGGVRSEAIARYRELLQYEPQYSAAHYNLGLLLLDEKAWQAAYEEFDWVVREDPQHVKGLFNRGRAAYRMSSYQQAIDDYEAALALQQGNYPEALLNRGLVLRAQKRYPEAEQSYRKAIAQRSDYPTAWYNLGLLQMRQKEHEEALNSFSRAVELSPDYSQAWYNIGVLQGRLENSQKAIEAYEEALRQRPKYNSARLNLAVRLMNEGQTMKAIEHYRIALEYDESYASAWYNLALAYMTTRDYVGADAALQRLLLLEPQNVKGLQLRAKTLIARKQYREAITLFEQALDIRTDSVTLRLELVQTLRNSGEQQRARRELYKALALAPDHQGLKAELKLLEQIINHESGAMQ
ncbi:MAG: tetratricopeptide repeat protein [Chromatiales bacterium]|nr:tetratricopeptide repeat protein [Chromatiales bacterium]